MAENPLLPHRKLMEMYELMKRLRAMRHPASARVQPNHDAVLASVFTQMEAKDVFCASGLEATMSALGPQSATQTPSALAVRALSATRAEDVPAFSSTLAQGLKAEAAKQAVVSLTTAQNAVGWSDVLATAQSERLPLVAIVTANIQSAGFTWSAVTKLARKLQLPTISVDGEDAVALYRVVQECLHRAKQGDGPALVWCAYPSGKPAQSLKNLESYLAVRGLGPKARKPGKSS